MKCTRNNGSLQIIKKPLLLRDEFCVNFGCQTEGYEEYKKGVMNVEMALRLRATHSDN
jgi:hypothetical protein